MKIPGIFSALFVDKPTGPNSSSKSENQAKLAKVSCQKDQEFELKYVAVQDKFEVGHFNYFLKLIDDSIIQEFLVFDRCYKFADNYILAMAFIYFIRARLPVNQYDRIHFFAALYLAHDIEEDDEDLKCHIMRWGLGRSRKDDVDYFLEVRDGLWKAMNFRACVSFQCCLQVMRSVPNCILWQRTRSPVHSGAIRNYDDLEEECIHCHQRDVRFYNTDLESDDSEAVSSEDEEGGISPIKKMRLNEE